MLQVEERVEGGRVNETVVHLGKHLLFRHTLWFGVTLDLLIIIIIIISKKIVTCPLGFFIFKIRFTTVDS